jgi:hypothetical protein
MEAEKPASGEIRGVAGEYLEPRTRPIDHGLVYKGRAESDREYDCLAALAFHIWQKSDARLPAEAGRRSADSNNRHLRAVQDPRLLSAAQRSGKKKSIDLAIDSSQ